MTEKELETRRKVASVMVWVCLGMIIGACSLGIFVFFPQHARNIRRLNYDEYAEMAKQLRMTTKILQDFLAIAKSLPTETRRPVSDLYGLARASHVALLEQYRRGVAFRGLDSVDGSGLPEGESPLPPANSFFVPPEEVP